VAEQGQLGGGIAGLLELGKPAGVLGTTWWQDEVILRVAHFNTFKRDSCQQMRFREMNPVLK
jgi:hypothetical protein